eukprot:15464291-Alexandrium_andersonii.AAC.1
MHLLAPCWLPAKQRLCMHQFGFCLDHSSGAAWKRCLQESGATDARQKCKSNSKQKIQEKQKFKRKSKAGVMIKRGAT